MKSSAKSGSWVSARNAKKYVFYSQVLYFVGQIVNVCAQIVNFKIILLLTNRKIQHDKKNSLEGVTGGLALGATSLTGLTFQFL